MCLLLLIVFLIYLLYFHNRNYNSFYLIIKTIDFVYVRSLYLQLFFKSKKKSLDGNKNFL